MKELPDINSGISKSDLFEKFKLQLKKDFEGSGLNGDFADTLEAKWESILKNVITEIEKVNKQPVSKLTGLLYRVDVSELQIKKLKQEKQQADMNEVIAELFIKRELQKVIIKEHYRNK